MDMIRSVVDDAQQTDGMPVTELHAILTILREILQTLTGGSPRDEKLAAMLADAISRIQLQVNAVFDPREAGRALAPEVDKRQGGTAVLHTDFGMILTDLSLEMPEVKTKYQTLPLENGSIDLSEVVTGRPVYGLRTLKLTFKRRGASASEWLSVCSQIASAVHGKRLPITLPDDPDHYYLGRIACAPGAKEYGAGTFEVTAVCDPYKYAQAESSAVCGAGTTAVLNSGDEIVSPTFTASETGMTVALNGGAAYSIAQVGKAVKIPELLLLPGANNVTVTGTGNVILTWREGVL